MCLLNVSSSQASLSRHSCSELCQHFDKVESVGEDAVADEVDDSSDRASRQQARDSQVQHVGKDDGRGNAHEPVAHTRDQSGRALVPSGSDHSQGHDRARLKEQERQECPVSLVYDSHYFRVSSEHEDQGLSEDDCQHNDNETLNKSHFRLYSQVGPHLIDVALANLNARKNRHPNLVAKGNHQYSPSQD